MGYIKSVIKSNKTLFYIFFRLRFLIKYEVPMRLLPDSFFVKRRYKKRFGFYPNLKCPTRLTEKMQVLKLHDHRDIYTLYADKYRVRNYIADNFGEEYLIPLLFHTDTIDDINPQNLPNEPFVLKANTGCGTYQIIHDKSCINWPMLLAWCKLWVKNNHYYYCQEWQYKNIKPCYIVEKLLKTKAGLPPNDYKLFYIAGELKFVHVSVNSDINSKYKIEYDPDWRPLPFSWERKRTTGVFERGAEIPRPASFDKMKEIGSAIAKTMPQVRVDFYDIDGKLYFGEITMCHGSGINVFIPDKYDVYFGNMLELPSF